MELDPKFDDQIMQIIASGVPGKFKKTRISQQTHLQKELGLDSLGVLALVFKFEEHFGIDIAQLGIEINIAKLKTVNDLIHASHEIMDKAQTMNTN